MRPRIKTIPRFAACLALAAAALCASFTIAGCAANNAGHNPKTAVSGPIEFYRGPLNHLSAVRDGTCPMHPSCSAYAVEALDTHGLLTGSIMTFDRLIRCGRDETEYAEEIYINNNGRYHDPVRHNDFWWSQNDPDAD